MGAVTHTNRAAAAAATGPALSDLVPLARVAAVLGKNLVTVERWGRLGLRTVKLGRTRYTTEAWLAEYGARQDGA